jgi:hypothetical protein
MNRLEREILKAVLIDEKSIYGVEAYLKETGIKSNYATVWRYIGRMKSDGLLAITKPLRKDGKPDKRGTEKPVITPKGIATLLIDGDLQKEELRIAGLKILQRNFSDIPNKLWRVMPLEEIIADALLNIKPKVNLKFFDKDYFLEIFVTSFLESCTSKSVLESVLENAKKVKLTVEEALQFNDILRKISEKEGFPQQPLEDMFEWGKQLGAEARKKEKT